MSALGTDQYLLSLFCPQNDPILAGCDVEKQPAPNPPPRMPGRFGEAAMKLSIYLLAVLAAVVCIEKPEKPGRRGR